MALTELPRSAAWEHCAARSGFEVVVVDREDRGGHVFRGSTAAVESGQAWAVDYEITVDADWCTRHARVVTRSAHGRTTTVLSAVGDGRWHVDGRHDPRLDGLSDVDLEASALTNTLPVHRLRLPVGETAEATAVYVRVPDGTVEPLAQAYRRLADGPAGERYDYRSPAFDVRCVLSYDAAGLPLDYPGIAVRRA